jgi:hypothetical protein
MRSDRLRALALCALSAGCDERANRAVEGAAVAIGMLLLAMAAGVFAAVLVLIANVVCLVGDAPSRRWGWAGVILSVPLAAFGAYCSYDGYTGWQHKVDAGGSLVPAGALLALLGRLNIRREKAARPRLDSV